MTDDELNEIFRAIRHRRTLSWATIEKMANEVRDGRAAKKKKATYRWTTTYDDGMFPTTMFHPKPAEDLKPKAQEVLDRISASIQRKYEDKVYEHWMGYTSTDPKSVQVPTIDEIMKRVMFAHESAEAMGMIRERSAFHKLVSEPIADSKKKE